MLKTSSAMELIIIIVVVIIFILIYKMSFNYIKSISNSILRNLLNGFFIFIYTILTITTIKLFLFDIYKTPSVSMESTLFPEDIILVDKLKYGARLPRSSNEIPFINILSYYFAKGSTRGNVWGYKRMIGLDNISQSDVIVFNSTYDNNGVFVKRCVAISGDTLRIKNDTIYINNKLFPSIISIRYVYSFKVINKKNIYKIVDSLSLKDIELLNIKDNFHQASLSKFELSQLRELNCLDSLTRKIDAYNIEQKTFSNLPKWSFDNMGPFIVPKNGLKINLNHVTYSLYKEIINNFENCKLKFIDDVFFINNKKVDSYTFKQDYYFMMGDNRNRSLDSRLWGFLPEQNIIGKVQYVLYSKFQESFQWDRLFKVVN